MINIRQGSRVKVKTQLRRIKSGREVETRIGIKTAAEGIGKRIGTVRVAIGTGIGGIGIKSAIKIGIKIVSAIGTGTATEIGKVGTRIVTGKIGIKTATGITIRTGIRTKSGKKTRTRNGRKSGKRTGPGAGKR